METIGADYNKVKLSKVFFHWNCTLLWMLTYKYCKELKMKTHFVKACSLTFLYGQLTIISIHKAFHGSVVYIISPAAKVIWNHY